MNRTAVAVRRRRILPLVCMSFGLLLTCVDVIAFGLNRNLRFERVLEGSEEIKNYAGALTSIAQDETGFIWFGGENGLARFDGVQFKHYKHSGHSGALPSNYIRDLATDNDGVMWLATDGGLGRYFPQTDSFEVFKPDYSTPNSLPHNAVTAIAVDRHNNLILGTGSGISILQSDRQTYVNIPLSVDTKNVTFVFDTFVDSKHRIWVGTRDIGLFLLSPKGEFIRHFRANQDDPLALQSDTIKTIEEDQFGRIWVGTYGGGASRINEGERGFTNYAYDPQQTGSIGSNTIWDIHLDSDDELWFSTDQGGLARYMHESDSFIHFRSSVNDRFTLSSNQVRTIFEDRDDNLWIATFPNGISFFDRAHSQITNYSHKHNDSASLTNSAVLDFLQTSDDILWIGTEDGLNQFSIDRKEFIGRYSHGSSSKNGLTASAILSLEEDYTGEIWVGTWSGGLYRFNRVSQEFIQYGPTNSSKRYLNSAFIWDIYLDSENTLWVATENGGLNRYERDSDSFTPFIHDQRDSNSIASNFVWSVLEDSRGNFWIATADGLDIMDRDNGRFRHFPVEEDNPKTISSARIRSLYEDRSGRIWIGTQDKGPFFYDPKTEMFTQVSWPQSLSTLVTSFIEDNLDFIWASTANGIARIEPRTLAVRSFHKSHGLIGDNFNRDATFKDRKGRLYFGSTEGFSVFDPHVFSRTNDDYPLVITDFKVFNQSVTVGEKGSPLTQAITYADSIELQHDHSMFSFDFAVLNYHSPLEYRYAYKLEGFDEQWHKVGHTHSATYTNIAPGKYLFKVRSSDRDDILNENVAQVGLRILPPLWRSSWALALYAIAALGVAAFLIRAFYRQMELKNHTALNSELTRVNQIKDDFLVNTSHELRAPLNNMVALADAVLRDHKDNLPGTVEQRVSLIAGHGKYLSSLITDILNYGNFSEHMLELNLESVNLFEEVETCLRLFQPLVYDKPVQLVNAVDPSSQRACADKAHLRQIFSSLIGNAIKYTQRGEVRICAKAEMGKLLVEVRDTGCGISLDKREELFSPSKSKTLTEQAFSRNGLGLAITKDLVELLGGTIQFQTWTEQDAKMGVSSGTQFSFTLPLSDELPLKKTPTQGAPLSPLDVDDSEVEAPKQAQPRRTNSGLKSKMVGELAPPERAERYRILIVDDDPINRMVLNGILSLHNYTVLEAGSGTEALNIVMHQAQPVDLIILDVMMPRMSGFDVCARLRQNYKQDVLPIVFLTAKYDEEDVKKGLLVGGNEVLYKPVNKDVLLPRVKAYLLDLECYRKELGH